MITSKQSLLRHRSTYHNQHEHGTDATFKKAKEESLDVDALVVFADRGEDQAKTPDDDNAGSNTLNWVALGKDHSGVSSNDEAKIEDGGRPGVSIAHKEVQVRSKAEDCLCDVILANGQLDRVDCVHTAWESIALS